MLFGFVNTVLFSQREKFVEICYRLSKQILDFIFTYIYLYNLGKAGIYYTAHLDVLHSIKNLNFLISARNAFWLSPRSTIDCDKPFQAVIARGISTFVRENSKIKYLESICPVLRVGVDKCCKGIADRE